MCPVVRITPTGIGSYTKITKSLVQVHDKVSIFLTIFIVAIAIMTFFTFSKFIIRSSINLTFKQRMSIVHTETSSSIQPICNLICQTYIKHVAALFIGCNISISCPIWILGSVNRIFDIPILNWNLTSVIKCFKCLNCFKILTTRE